MSEHNAANNTSDNTSDESLAAQQTKWWRMPFDTTTNFSLLGWIFGNRYVRDSASKPSWIDLILK